ncbi:MAG: hypothetical protein MJA31_05660 [Clostridia bacterium]|nr:hypothetical protein [Clostridia bacterium]
MLEEKEKITEQYQSELEYLRKLNVIKDDLVIEKALKRREISRLCF